VSIPYKRNVAALDGSKLAECSISHAVALAECSDTELVLLCKHDAHGSATRDAAAGISGP
jgi:hypothetical protein